MVRIVGAGFSGSLTALQLHRAGIPVGLVERSGDFGPGLAYGPRMQPCHLLNTPAGRMSADPDDPDHFTRWLAAHTPGSHGGSFAPRTVFGTYLRTLVAASGAACIRGDVVEISGSADAWHLDLADGQRLSATQVVLAQGNLPPSRLPGFAAEVLAHPAYVGQPFAADWPRLAGVGPVLLIGTGLTACDVALSLHAAGHRGPIVAVSRRGLVPQAHRPAARLVQHPVAPAEAWPATARGLLRELRKQVDQAAAAGIDWREVITSLRPISPALWRRLPVQERERFLRHLRPYWDSHRHRAAPATAAAVAELIAENQLQIQRMRVVGAAVAGDQLAVRFQHGRDVVEDRYAAVINCTGPASDPASDPMLARLLAQGLVTADPLGLGLATTDAGQCLGPTGIPVPGLYVVGPLRRATAWEATAVHELAGQAADMARTLASPPSG